MNVKKTLLSSAIGLALGGVTLHANAAVTSGATLDFVLGSATTVSCNYGTTPPCNKASYAVTDVVGSYFSMDTNGNGVENSEKTPIGSLNGIVLGTTQGASGSHTGPIDGTESPNIDAPWTFFGGTGMHQTTSAITDNGDGTMDFSGWNVTWNGIASIPVVATSPTTIVCDTATCSDTSSYTIDGAFHVNGAGFTTVAYTVHLEGGISAPSEIPVPAAVWLFGSGLLGLAGVARRKAK